MIVDFETRQEWLSIMPELKKQMIETHEEILLNYHTGEDESRKVEILGRLSYVRLHDVLANGHHEKLIKDDLDRLTRGTCWNA